MTAKKTKEVKQENLIYVTAKENVSDRDLFIRAGERKGLSSERVNALMKSRFTKNLIEVEK